jgi:hypothetical protein
MSRGAQERGQKRQLGGASNRQRLAVAGGIFRTRERPPAARRVQKWRRDWVWEERAGG